MQRQVTMQNPILRNAQQLGVAIRSYRLAKKLTQKQLADQVGLRQSTISAVEAGNPGSRSDTIFILLSGLDLEFVLQPRIKYSEQKLEDIFKW